jgi:hypothetical protein
MATDRNRALPGVVSGGLAVLLGVTALVLWTSRDYVAAQFASSYGLTIGLWIQNDSDRPRLERALAALTVPDDVNASYSFDRNSSRRSQIEVSAPTRAKAVAAARALGDIVAKAYDSAGETKLDARVPNRAYPEENATTTKVRTAITYGAPVMGLLAIGLFVVAWRDRLAVGDLKVPRWAGLAVTAAVLLPVALIVLPGWLFMAAFAMMIPSGIAGFIVYKMGELRRAARWPSAQARIVRSKLRTVDTKTADGAASRGNMPDIEYVFSVDGAEYHGKRIGIGEIRPDSPAVGVALERYQVGRTGPVFYNPENPKEAVLERDPPASPRTMYAIAAGVMLLGFAVVVAFSRIGEIIQWLEPYFPPGAVIQGVLFFVACGLVAGLSLLSDLASALAAARWPTVAGTVITSRVESRRELAPGGGNRTTVVCSPLVEYVYRVGERDYHGARIGFGPAVSGGRGLAEAIIARYPASTTVTVHYDPANPSQATLETRVSFGWTALVIVVLCFVAALFFSGRL